jgi:ribosome biogenesis protein ENP2
MHSFFIPNLGLAPKWCHFLDNLVHEMENDTRTETYDNYKFLTVPELKALSLSHLIGKTNLLRPYMHGYFVAAKLYDQARLIANPYIWEEERAKRIKEKVEKERASRIRGVKKVKVNQKLADKLLQRQENRDKVDDKAGILGDDRFQKIFEDEEFKVDENSYEFRALNPSTKIPGDVGYQPPRNTESSEEDSDEDSEEEKDSDGVVMKVSSSRAQGGRTRDTAIGSRVQKTTRTTRPHSGDIVGEKQVTFVPESKKKARQQAPAPANKRSEGRRSASTNTFRRL